MSITPLILTFNEAPNIRRTLERLVWAKQIIVIDSFSNDETESICRQFSQVHFIQRHFDSFAGQCNFGLTFIKTPWVLSLDADYVLSEDLVSEITSLKPASSVNGFRASFVYCIAGQRLRGALYPPRMVLYRVSGAQYFDEGHGHRVQVEGPIQELKAPVFHDDRKPLDRWLVAQKKYAKMEAQNLLETPVDKLNFADGIRRRIIFAPWLLFFYTLFGKQAIFDGWAGWYYAFQRAYAEILLSLHLLDAKTAKDSSPQPQRTK